MKESPQNVQIFEAFLCTMTITNWLLKTYDYSETPQMILVYTNKLVTPSLYKINMNLLFQQHPFDPIKHSPFLLLSFFFFLFLLSETIWSCNDVDSCPGSTHDFIGILKYVHSSSPVTIPCRKLYRWRFPSRSSLVTSWLPIRLQSNRVVFIFIHFN